MSKNIEIYWQDLTPEKQQEILEAFGENCNYDTFPIATLTVNPKDLDSSENDDGFDDYLSICEEVLDLFHQVGLSAQAISERMGRDVKEILDIIEDQSDEYLEGD